MKKVKYSIHENVINTLLVLTLSRLEERAPVIKTKKTTQRIRSNKKNIMNALKMELNFSFFIF